MIPTTRAYSFIATAEIFARRFETFQRLQKGQRIPAQSKVFANLRRYSAPYFGSPARDSAKIFGVYIADDVVDIFITPKILSADVRRPFSSGFVRLRADQTR